MTTPIKKPLTRERAMALSLDMTTGAAAPPSTTKQLYEQSKNGTVTLGAVYRLRSDGMGRTNTWAQVLAEQDGKVAYLLWPKVGPAQTMDAKAFKFMYTLEDDETVAGKVLSELFKRGV